MINWRPDGEPEKLENIVIPLKRTLKDLIFSLKGRSPVKDLFYDGFTLGDNELVSSLPPDQSLSFKNLCREKQQGRDPLDIILGIAVQLGIEQGRRIYKKHEKHLDVDLWGSDLFKYK